MSRPRAPLAELRRRVADADREITRGIRRRLRLAAAIGRSKQRSGVALRDFALEAQVLSRWQRSLDRAGVDGVRSASLARWLIEESLRVQESIPVRRSHALASSPRVGLIGGAGGMGRWLDKFLTDAGHDVFVVDPRADPHGPRTLPSISDAMDRCDVVFFATPLRSTAPLMEQAFARSSRAVVADVLSVKSPILPVIRAARRAGHRVTSTHPMFGPSARTLSGRNLLLVTCGVPEADRVVRDLFASSALTLTEVPVDAHDALIAESLGLAHAVNLLFLSALAADPRSPVDLAAAASTTFHRQSSLASAVAREGGELYLDIQALNPHSPQVYRALRSALDRLERIVGRSDRAGFDELLAAGRAKLEPGPEPMRA